MFDFNKRDVAARGDEFPVREEPGMQPGAQSSQAAAARRPASGHEAAIIGPSIHIEGDLHGEEDLLIEGEVKGTVHLKHHSLTIGSQGKVTANVFANAINVDGFMQGDLYGAERISIRKSAQVQGNVSSPRVSLEDGARFKGTIEMDPDSDVLKSAFGESRTGTRSGTVPAATPASPPAKAAPANPGTGSSPAKPYGTPAGTSVKSGKSA